jgi:hypothetical protein
MKVLATRQGFNRREVEFLFFAKRKGERAV